MLHAPKGEVRIAPMPMRSHTDSVMFDALFALAQQEMDQDRVDAIRDPAFDEGRPVPCDCFQTGARWPMCGPAMSASPPIWRWRGWTRSGPGSRCSSLSAARDGRTPGLFVAQDTGSGGSWPISSDRVVWFLAARHLLEDRVFADQVWQALQGTLAQDRAMVFDAQMGLYRGETSFLDWREQTYPTGPARTCASSVIPTHCPPTCCTTRHCVSAERWLVSAATPARPTTGRADALAQQIDTRFWREDMGQYMSYIGEAAHRCRTPRWICSACRWASGRVLPPERAHRALAAYPRTPAGSPVWPQEAQQPIYHNRARSGRSSALTRCARRGSWTMRRASPPKSAR